MPQKICESLLNGGYLETCRYARDACLDFLKQHQVAQCMWIEVQSLGKDALILSLRR